MLTKTKTKVRNF